MIRLIVPPFPAVSRLSNTTQILTPDSFTRSTTCVPSPPGNAEQVGACLDAEAGCLGDFGAPGTADEDHPGAEVPGQRQPRGNAREQPDRS